MVVIVDRLDKKLWNLAVKPVAGLDAGRHGSAPVSIEARSSQHFSRFYTEEDRKVALPVRAVEIAAREGKF